MTKVITFSRVFPAYHPRAGEPTHFIEKYWAGKLTEYDWKAPLMALEIADPKMIVAGKLHTIRAGHHWKPGDWFSPRVWSGRPYNSKQLVFGPPTEVKQVWDFSMDKNGIYSINGKYADEEQEQRLYRNDGLSEKDFFNWFMPDYNKPVEFDGQIICWSDKLKY